MSFKNFFVLTCSVLILSSTPLLAKTFSLKVKSYGPCSEGSGIHQGYQYEDYRCDLHSMQTQLMSECEDSGYHHCIITQYESNTSSSFSFGCGEVEKTVCKVKVKGTNSNSF